MEYINAKRNLKIPMWQHVLKYELSWTIYGKIHVSIAYHCRLQAYENKKWGSKGVVMSKGLVGSNILKGQF